MPLTASSLRQNIYRILDSILESGQGVEIERRGQRLRIEPVKPKSKLERLTNKSYLNVAPDELVHLDWSDEWKP